MITSKYCTFETIYNSVTVPMERTVNVSLIKFNEIISLVTLKLNIRVGNPPKFWVGFSFLQKYAQKKIAD